MNENDEEQGALEQGGFTQNSGMLPEIVLRVTHRVGEYITDTVEIVGRGWTDREAADLFNHALDAYPVLKKVFSDEISDAGKSGNS